jgi:sialate O-acetylesterase
MDDTDNFQISILGSASKGKRFSRRETMKFRTQISFLILCFLVAVNSAAAALRLPALVSDHMVLQQGTDAPLWGWAEPGEKVQVQGSWQDSPSTTTADDQGQWKVTLDTPQAGGPYRIEFKTAEDEMTVENVMVGEVWVCSGQSNMEMGLMRSDPWTKGVFNYKSEIAAADYPNHRRRSQTSVPSPTSSPRKSIRKPVCPSG